METSSQDEMLSWPVPMHLVGHLLRRAQQMHAGLWSELGPPELTSPQFAVLLELVRRPGASQIELGARTGIDRSTLAEMIGRMVQRGLVDRVEDTTDKRRKLLSISTQGTRRLEEGLPLVLRLNQQLVSTLTESEQAQLKTLLEKVLR